MPDGENEELDLSFLLDAEPVEDDHPLLDFGLGGQVHREIMTEMFPEVAARMPLEEQHFYCTRCGHRDDRWWGAFCPGCGMALLSQF